MHMMPLSCISPSAQENLRIFSAVAGTGFLTTLAWSTETSSFLISMPEVSRRKITSLSEKTCSETLLPSGLKGCGCMCKSQQVQVALLYLTGHPLEVFRSKAMPCLRGSRQRRRYLELLQLCGQDKLMHWEPEKECKGKRNTN